MSADTGKDLFRLGFLTAIEVPERGYVGGLLVTNQFGRPLEFQCTTPLKPNRTQEILYGPTLVPYVLGDLIGRTLVEKVGVKPHLVLTERQDLLGLRELVAIPVACVDELPAGSLPTVAAETSTARETTEAAVSDEAAPDNGNLLEPTEPVVVDQSLRADSTDAGTVREPVPSPSILESSIAEPALAIDENAAATNGTSSAEVLEPTRSGEATVEVKRSGAARAKAQEGDCSPIQLGRQLLRFHVAHGEDRTVASRGARVVPNNADLREPFERVREALGETARMGGAR